MNLGSGESESRTESDNIQCEASLLKLFQSVWCPEISFSRWAKSQRVILHEISYVVFGILPRKRSPWCCYILEFLCHFYLLLHVCYKWITSKLLSESSGSISMTHLQSCFAFLNLPLGNFPVIFNLTFVWRNLIKSGTCWPVASAWLAFLEIAFVWEVCVCVSPPHSCVRIYDQWCNVPWYELGSIS